jgi:hypothetical protein
MIGAAALAGLDLIRSSFAARVMEEGAGEALLPSSAEDEHAAAIRMQPILERVNDARPVDRRGLLAPRMKPRSIRTRCRRDRATATKTLRPPKSA